MSTKIPEKNPKGMLTGKEGISSFKGGIFFDLGGHMIDQIISILGAPNKVFSFLKNNSDPTEREIREAISGNICRCTGYQNIVNAALDAAKVMRGS